MDIVNSIIKFLKSGKSHKEEAPEGLCPNCWGTQEYGGEFFEAVKTHGLDVNKKDLDVGWVREYAERNLKGIRLHEHEEELICEKCKLSFRKKS